MPWTPDDPRQPDSPEPGFYALRLVKKGPEVGAEIYFTGSVWRTKINGGPVDLIDYPQMSEALQQVWLFGRRIDQQEYDFLLARYKHYAQHDPSHPFANPNKPINRRLMKPIE